MDSGKRRYVIIFTEIFDDKTIREEIGFALPTFLSLLGWSDPKTGIIKFISVKKIVERNGMNSNTVEKHIKRLKEKGFIRVNQRHPNSVEIEILRCRRIWSVKNGGSDGHGSVDNDGSEPYNSEDAIKYNNSQNNLFNKKTKTEQKNNKLVCNGSSDGSDRLEALAEKAKKKGKPRNPRIKSHDSPY